MDNQNKNGSSQEPEFRRISQSRGFSTGQQAGRIQQNPAQRRNTVTPSQNQQYSRNRIHTEQPTRPVSRPSYNTAQRPQTSRDVYSSSTQRNVNSATNSGAYRQPVQRSAQRPNQSSQKFATSQTTKNTAQRPAVSQDLDQAVRKAKKVAGKTGKKVKKMGKGPKIAALVLFVVVVIGIVIAALYRENPEKLDLSTSPVYISEYMSKNSHYFNSKQKTPDWIEIYNPTGEDVDISGYRLKKDKYSYKLKNAVVPAKGYYLLFIGAAIGKEDKISLNNEMEEVIYLTDTENDLVDLVNTQVIKKNKSVKRTYSSDGELTEKVFKTPTPGFANNAKGLAKYIESLKVENDTGIAFNEVMAANKNTYVDEFGNTVDYVELINTGSKTVNLSGYGLSDNAGDMYKYKFPDGTKLESGAVILVNCSKDYKTKDENGETVLKESTTGALLADFNLNSGKETVYLSNDEAHIIEEFSLATAGSDQSIARADDGTYTNTYYISPGYENNNEGIAAYNQTIPSVSDLSTVYISEAMSRNLSYAKINDTAYDWVELYNPTDKTIDLSGYSLSNKSKNPTKFKLDGHTIEAKSYLLVYCTDEVLSGVICSGFKLNGGCACYLYNSKQELIDKVTLGETLTDVSKGRDAGNSQLVYYSTPTPGEANGESSTTILAAPVASVKSGQYNNVDSLSVELSANGTIYYTTDGSVPTTKSTKYTGAISVNKSTVIRAIAVASGSIRSSVAAFSYIVNENHKMDVISVVSDPDGLFSTATGIFATGTGASSVFPYLGANYWQGWKRESTMSLLPEEGSDEEGFTETGAISIFGGYSKAYNKKSFKIKFKDVYGSGTLKYALFENRDITEYDSLVLRAGGQDVSKTMMKDDLITSLADSVVDVMATRPVVVYINAEYYGIYYIREKINASYIATHYNVSEDSVDLIQGGSTVKEGSIDDYRELVNYFKNNDISKTECYNWVKKHMDVQNYADYVISELYCGNTDLGNIRCFKSSDGDNKWRWILFDTDLGFMADAQNSVWEFINPAGNGASDMFPTTIINGLLKNKEFRALFVKRLEYQMKNVWNTDRVVAQIDKFADEIGDEVSRNNERWEVTYDWEAGVEALRSYARGRQETLKEEFASSTNVRNIIALTDDELDRCFGY